MTACPCAVVQISRLEQATLLPSFYAEDTPTAANETWARLHADPLFAIRQQEVSARKQVVQNPAQMLRIRQQVSLYTSCQLDSFTCLPCWCSSPFTEQCQQQLHAACRKGILLSQAMLSDDAFARHTSAHAGPSTEGAAAGKEAGEEGGQGSEKGRKGCQEGEQGQQARGFAAAAAAEARCTAQLRPSCLQQWTQA